MSFEFSEVNLQKLEVKCRYLLTQIKQTSTDLWEEFVDSYEETDIEDLPNWYETARKTYNEFLANREE